MKWKAVSPANLALIKYMGKKTPSSKATVMERNIPLNPSLSFTLKHFLTKVEIEEAPTADDDMWSPFKTGDPFRTDLPLSAQKSFLDFFKQLKKLFSLPGCYRIRSGNNFPLSMGAASSASGFSALTRAVYKSAREKDGLKRKLSRKELAQISRAGSGSSCRSFFSPWALWTEKEVRAVKFPFKDLIHQMIVTESSGKKIPSRRAHERVKSGPHFKGRTKRAERRLQGLCHALRRGNWRECFTITREEFLDMHRLFETSRPPFSYQTPESKRLLAEVESFWRKRGDGPLVTMDAGSGLHLLYRPDQERLIREISALLSLEKHPSYQNVFRPAVTGRF